MVIRWYQMMQVFDCHQKLLCLSLFFLSGFVNFLVLQLAGEVLTVQAPGKCLAEADATGYLKATQNWLHMTMKLS